MDARAAKLALARQKLKTHQEKKQVVTPKDEPSELTDEINAQDTINSVETVTASIQEDSHIITQDQNTLIEGNIESLHIASSFHNGDVHVTEMLISTKRKLELQVDDLRLKLDQLENSYTLVVNNNDYCKQQILNLENEIKTLQDRLVKSTEENFNKEKIISELSHLKSAYNDENNNLQEQLEFTKNILTTKETENNALRSQIVNLQVQLDAIQLQLQQITNGSQGLVEQTPADPDLKPEVLLQKISNLEQQQKSLQKDKDQLSVHYEHYLVELNDQLKASAKRNYDLEIELKRLTTRESSLIEQISEMELKIQTMRQKPVENIVVDADDNAKIDIELNELRGKCGNLQVQLETFSKKYDELRIKFAESETTVQELMQAKEIECEHDNLSLSKLTADMASDKVAAQRATEQNKRLKKDLHDLEEAFVKLSRDKLELTEKVTAEKFLNRELTIKLAEVDEKAKDMHTKLLAKDEEMIRLQNSYREIEKKIEDNATSHKINPPINDDNEEHGNCSGHDISHSENEHENYKEKLEEQTEHQCLLITKTDKSVNSKEDAMVKLQDRFLKIMDEVANLSDEKHRLEHIILQLQTETDTICEYVALYQQQRSLLKKRDEERSAQIKIFQTECDQLKRQLEELSGIIIKLAQDTELATFFQSEPRQSDLVKVMNLLEDLKSNTLVDPCKSSSELKNFYPCSCCSGQLIEV